MPSADSGISNDDQSHQAADERDRHSRVAGEGQQARKTCRAAQERECPNPTQMRVGAGCMAGPLPFDADGCATKSRNDNTKRGK